LGSSPDWGWLSQTQPEGTKNQEKEKLTYTKESEEKKETEDGV